MFDVRDPKPFADRRSGSWNRRDLMRYALLLPAGALFSHFKVLAEPLTGKVKTKPLRV